MVQDESLDVLELEESLAEIEKPAELPAGTYTGEIVDVQIGDSQKGNRYYQVKFHIAPEEIPADMQDQFEDGADMFWNRQIVPTGKDRRALFNLRKFIEAIGLDADTTTIDPNEWMGCTAKLKVRLGALYQGERRAEIASVEPADEPIARGRAAPAPVEEETPPPRATTRRAGRGR